LNDEVLTSAQNYTYIIIDDLDRDWADDKVKNDLIRNLFQVVLDLKRVVNLKVVVALRTNIFESLDFGRSGGQGEKYRALTMRLRWTAGELEGLLGERARVQSEKLGITPVDSVAQLLPNVNTTRPKPIDYILERTLMRPRDAIAYLNECFRSAGGAQRLSWADMKSAETTYSRNRLLALRDEWEPTYPGIDHVLQKFRQAPGAMTAEAITKYFDDVMELYEDYKFVGVQWLTEISAPLWNCGPADEWSYSYRLLIKLLYDIGFLGLKLAKTGPVTFGHDEPEFADSVLNIRGAREFVIHPAFRSALDISDSRPGDRRSGKRP
jgi:hypothetical protein